MKRIEKNGKWAMVEKTKVGFLISIGYVGEFKACDITEWPKKYITNMKEALELASNKMN